MPAILQLLLLTICESLRRQRIGQQTLAFYVNDTQILLDTHRVNKRWKKPPPTRNNKNPNMLTRQQTERARLQSEKKTAEAALKLQMEKGTLKRLEEKKKRDAERKQEEELRKNAEAEQRKLQVLTIAEATVVSPPTQMEEDRADPSINSHLSDMIQGGSEEDAAGDEGEQRSPAKSKQKKFTFPEATASKPVLKPRIKSSKAQRKTSL